MGGELQSDGSVVSQGQAAKAGLEGVDVIPGSRCTSLRGHSQGRFLRMLPDGHGRLAVMEGLRNVQEMPQGPSL